MPEKPSSSHKYNAPTPLLYFAPGLLFFMLAMLILRCGSSSKFYFHFLCPTQTKFLFLACLMAPMTVFQLLSFRNAPWKFKIIPILLLLFYTFCILKLTRQIEYDVRRGPSVAKCLGDLRSIEEALEAFHRDVGRYPTPPEGLAILAENSANLENWKGPYIKLQPDPWGNDYLYLIPPRHNPHHDILSTGDDGILGTDDDVLSK